MVNVNFATESLAIPFNNSVNVLLKNGCYDDISDS